MSHTATRPQDSTERSGDSLLRQPPAVWAVAFAAMVAFMGIGLVGPILPTISEELNSTPTQTSFLFTSYLAVTAVAMFFTSWLSSRIGTRTTMLLGLAVIVVAAAFCALSTSIEGVIAFRALWGLGNALFLSTALASIISASGGRPGHAVILYEAALGLGLAIGPLAGGLLGEINWMAPFWGTASLMAVGFVAIITIVCGSGRPAEKSHVLAPFKALAIRPILIMSIVAFFYNSSFFVTLAYVPYPLGMSEPPTSPSSHRTSRADSGPPGSMSGRRGHERPGRHCHHPGARHHVRVPAADRSTLRQDGPQVRLPGGFGNDDRPHGPGLRDHADR